MWMKAEMSILTLRRSFGGGSGYKQVFPGSGRAAILVRLLIQDNSEAFDEFKVSSSENCRESRFMAAGRGFYSTSHRT